MANEAEKKACKRKRRFGGDADAQASLKKINPTRSLNKPSRVYKCDVCFGYHLTSQR